MRVLIIGLGSIAKKHITVLREIDPSIELFALRCSGSPKEVNGVRNVFEWSDVKGLGLDFIIISNPTFKHRETIEKLLSGENIPLFIEKPLFDKLDGENLIQAINEKNTITYVACNLRFLDCLQFAKSIIASKRINEVNIYCGSYLPDWRPGQNFRKIYSANQEMGGGVHIDLIHEIDYACWMFGKPASSRRTITSTSSLEITAADYANYLLQYDQFNINIVLNYFRRDARRTLEVVCEDGTLNVDILKGEVFWCKNLVYSSSQQISDTYLNQMIFFIDNVLTRKTSLNTIDEAYEILNICLAN